MTNRRLWGLLSIGGHGESRCWGSARVAAMLSLALVAVVALVVPAALSGVGFVRPLETNSYAKNVSNRLQTEFDTITPPTGALLFDHETQSKAGSALVESSYSYANDYDSIHSYYDSVLDDHGWQYRSETPVRIWGVDYGGRERVYCKADMTVSLYYRGSDPDSKSDYTLAVSWGQPNKCR